MQTNDETPWKQVKVLGNVIVEWMSAGHGCGVKMSVRKSGGVPIQNSSPKRADFLFRIGGGLASLNAYIPCDFH